MLHLVAQKARQLKRKIDVIFLDWEAQFSSTIQHVDTMRTLYRDVIHQFWWVALPLTTQNALSQFQPEWQCWEPETNWVRQPPEDAITDYHYFDFYQQGMTFEAFVREFAEWYAQNVLPPSWWGSAPMNLTTAFWLSRRRVSSAFLTINHGRPSPRVGTPGISTPCTTGKPPTSGRGSRNQNVAITRYTT